MRGGFGERHDAQVIGLAMAGGIRRHIGEHDVYFSWALLPSMALSALGRGVIEKIEM